MAFDYAVTKTDLVGTHWEAWGTFTNGGSDTGGNIVTGLTYVDQMQLTAYGATAPANAASVTTDLPATGGTVGIITIAGIDGVWVAKGRRN